MPYRRPCPPPENMYNTKEVLVVNYLKQIFYFSIMEKKMDIKVLVATHKKYWMPTDPVYVPLQVGASLHESLGYLPDNTDDNISMKNHNYCELTGIYWAWKNLKCDYIGLCHYRRYFGRKIHTKNIDKKKKSILNSADYERLLQKYDVILPKQRNYYIETVRSQYEHAHYKKDLKLVENIIQQKYPTYQESFDYVMNKRSLHLWNMFVMNQKNFHSYCEWLFDILFTLEPHIDIQKYNAYEARVFGFLGERLFNVWLAKNHFRTVDIPVVNLEAVNWPKKIEKFLARKFVGKGREDEN